MHLNARFIGLAALLLIATTAAVLLVGTRGFDRDTPLAFPELEGFGSKTIGGRGGQILKVTSLADAGEGTLRWALEEVEGPRIVVFDVSGVITMSKQIEIKGDVTVAGQSAPAGVTIAGGRLRVVESNVILRGLRIRPGDGPGASAQSRDAISIGTPDKTVSRVVIDSNSLTWAIDENLSIWGDVRDVTISRNIIAEALDAAGHDKGDHSMGLLIGGGDIKRITIVDNLFAHNRHRNPTIKGQSNQVEFVNNLVYNWGANGFEAKSGSIHLLGNVYLDGPDTADKPPIRLAGKKSEARYYLSDNFGEATPQHRIQAEPVFRESGVQVHAMEDVEAQVLARAGARQPELDAIDSRIVETVTARTGRIINSQEEVGGYITVRDSRAPPDHDNDGIPDVVERELGSNPLAFDSNDRSTRSDPTHIERYLNRMVESL